MSTTITVLFFILLLIGIWAVLSWFAISGLEQPEYEVLQTGSDYEVRQYQPYLVAETTVNAENERQALGRGFSLIADYIFGNNTVSEKISMTTPVTSNEKTAEKISMTTPVTSAESASGSRTVSFVMPAKYTLESIPKPNNKQVQLREVPARVMAVRQFSWFASNERIESQKNQLRAALTAANLSFSESMQYAGYNPPLSAPFMRRHEVATQIAWDGFPLESNTETSIDESAGG